MENRRLAAPDGSARPMRAGNNYWIASAANAGVVGTRGTHQSSCFTSGAVRCSVSQSLKVASLITKNEFELMTLSSCGINTKELNFNLSFGFTQKMCQILDEYEGAKTHDSFKRDLNAEFGIIVHQALLPLKDHMGSFPASILAILDTLNELLNDHHFESLTGLLEIFDHFYVHVASLYQELLVFKRQTFTKMKQCLVEMALASIVEDLERVTEEEAQGFRESRREMLSQASMMDVNFAKFDVDEIIEE